MIQQPLKKKIYKLEVELAEKQKQSDLLTLGLLQEKNKVTTLIAAGEEAIIALCFNCSSGPIQKCYPDTKAVCRKGKASLAMQQALGLADPKKRMQV